MADTLWTLLAGAIVGYILGFGTLALIILNGGASLMNRLLEWWKSMLPCVNPLDPDTRLVALDKLEHFSLPLSICFGLTFLMPLDCAFGSVVGLAAGWEGGQVDNGRFVAEQHQNNDITQRFKPGYGFGLLDLAMGVLGASLAVFIRLFVWG